ncbi:Uncharacterized protein HZ326_20289 [Fusarium oxysporum f. sp. albedinis]|nr:Uncharacterized protein HZ326_20289 [Fusarium oxysporum f. sp. albedinis]
MEGAMGSDAPLMQIMFRAMLQEKSSHYHERQKKMPERLWALQHEIQVAKAQAAQLRIIQEQTSEQECGAAFIRQHAAMGGGGVSKGERGDDRQDALVQYKENGKMYDLMVAYVTKTGDVRRLLEERYFHLARELIGWVL